MSARILHVDLDALSEHARDNYLYARAVIGRGKHALIDTRPAERNGDNQPDQWEQYKDTILVAILYDEDFDGKVDRREEIVRAFGDAFGEPLPAKQPSEPPARHVGR